MAVLHFDAHLDTWDTYFGAPYTHGTPFRRASEEGLIDPERSLHVGIRGPLYADTDLEESTRLGYATVACTDYDRLGLDGVIPAMRERLGTGPVYVSVDIDVIDPGMAPGTGTPEAGGSPRASCSPPCAAWPACPGSTWSRPTSSRWRRRTTTPR